MKNRYSCSGGGNAREWCQKRDSYPLTTTRNKANNISKGTFSILSLWNSEKDKIKSKVRNLINDNLENVSENYYHIYESKEFYILLIKDVFVFLRNETNLLDRLSIDQLKEIPILIYNIAKESFSAHKTVYKELEFLEKINGLHGFIYVSINTLNKKPYVGQTTNTIEGEWYDIKNKAKALRNKRKFDSTIVGRSIYNAIITHGEHVWHLKLVDIAYSKSELNELEDYYIIDVYNSLVPNGYNMRRGGASGTHHPLTRKRISEGLKKFWDQPSKKEQRSKDQSKMWNRSGYRDMQKEAHKDTYESIEYKNMMSEAMSKVWKRAGYKEKQSKSISEYTKKRFKEDPLFRAQMELNLEKGPLANKINVDDITQFLIDIKTSKILNDVIEKYPFKSPKTLNRRIGEILEPFGIRRYSDAKPFLQHRSISDILEELKKLGHIK